MSVNINGADQLLIDKLCKRIEELEEEIKGMLYGDHEDETRGDRYEEG